MGTALLPDSDNQNKLYDSDKEIADLERLYHSDAAETSGSDIARQKEINALNDAYNLPDAPEPIPKAGGDNKGIGNNLGNMSGPRSGKDNPEMKYTGSGEQANKKRRIRNLFAKANPNRGRNFALLGGFGVFFAGIIITIVLLISSLSGIHLVNASRLLLASFGIASHQASATYAKIMSPETKGAPKTRLSVDRRIINRVYASTLKNSGIDFSYDNKTGKVQSAHLNPSKNSDLGGKSESRLKTYVAEKYGVSESDVKINRSGSGFEVEINMRNKPVGVQENIIRDFATRTGRGKILTFLVSRHFRQSLGVPSLFHPFKRAQAATQNAVGRYIDTKIRENERLKNLKAKMDERRLKIKGFLDANSFKLSMARISSSAVLAMCAVRDVAAAIEEQNRSAYVEPAQESAIDMIAQGDQVAFGEQNDFTADQIDSAAAHMYGDYYGQNLSIFDSDAMRARQGLPPIQISDATAASHYATDKTTIANAFTNVSPWQQAYDMTSSMEGASICQPVAQAALTIGDLALTIGLAAVSGGAAAAAKEAVSIGSVMGITSIVIGYMESASTNELPEITPNQGILGGDLMSQGADSVANVVSANSGGAVVSQARAEQLRQDAAGVDLSLAKEQSIAEKLSPTNIYSPVAKLVNSINPSPAQNVRNAASSFANIFMSTIRLPLTIFSSRAHAQDVSSSDSPTIALTAAVENKIASTPADTIVGDAASLASSYGERAGVCFGVKFLNSVDPESGDQYFDIQYDHQVDYYAPSYIDANCNDEKDDNWVTVSAAVNIVTVADAAACRETEDEDACNRTGMSTTTSTTSSAASAVNVGDLYKDSTSIACDPRTVTLGTATVTNKGGSITIQLCGMKSIPSTGEESTKGDKYYVEGADGMSIVNSRVSKAFADLADAAKAAGVKLTSGSTFRTRDHQYDLWVKKKDSSRAAPPGSSNHEVGIAIDFSISAPYKKDAPCSARSTARDSKMWNFLNGSPGSPGAQQFGIYQYAAEGWHWDASPTRCKEPI